MKIENGNGNVLIGNNAYNSSHDARLWVETNTNSTGRIGIQSVSKYASPWGYGVVSVFPNNQFKAFLFSSKLQFFGYSEWFSGNDVEFDSLNRRVFDFGTGGGASYGYSYLNLTKDFKNIEFVERIRIEYGVWSYEKLIGEKVVQRKKYIPKDSYEEFNYESWLERGPWPISE